MVVDLKWRDAMAVWSIGAAFSRELQAAGWPEFMTPAQLAGMQRPWHQGDLKIGRRASNALGAAIVAACNAGEITFNRSVLRRQTVKARFIPHEPYGGRGRDGVRVSVGHWEQAKFEDVETWSISAATFAKWLHNQGEAPSQHIAAWFASQGVAWPPVAVAAPVADTPLDWPGMVEAFKTRRKGQPWSPEEVGLLRAEFQKRGGWRKSDNGKTWSKAADVQEAMAGELGMKRQALDRHLGANPDHGQAAFGAMGGTLLANARR